MLEMLETFLTLTDYQNQRDLQASSSNSCEDGIEDGIEELTVIEIESD